MDVCKKHINEIINLSLKPHLKELGYKKSGNKWHLVETETIKTVNIQLSQWNDATEKRFTINLGVYFPRIAALLLKPENKKPNEYDCHRRARIGLLTPEKRDLWWYVYDDSKSNDINDIAKNILTLFKSYAEPWLSENSDLKVAMQGMWEPCHKPEDILGAAFLCNSEETVQEIYKKLLEKYPMAKSHLKNIMNVISRQHT